MTKHKIYVYGTLRPGRTQLVELPGKMVDLGRFPGVVPCHKSFFMAEPVEVSEELLDQLDVFEGYYPHSEPASFYVRRNCLDGHIYHFNGDVESALPVPPNNGRASDWLVYTGQKEGSNAASFAWR